MTSARQLFKSVLHLGSGETFARICGILTLLLLAHRYGRVIVGVYALGQTMSQFSVPFIDFGMRHVGARLVAQYPGAAREIVRRVQRRRSLMALALVPFLVGYAALTKLPWGLKAALLAFSVACMLYALSLDWLVWGKGHLKLVAVGRSIVPLTILLFILLPRDVDHVMWWLVLGNVVGILLQRSFFWRWWKRQDLPDDESASPPAIGDALAWQRTSILGIATLCNLAFNSIDMLMLGVMSNPQQVGLYSAAYRVVNQVLYTYYLLTQVLYPQLAIQNLQQRIRMLQPRILLLLLGGGVAVAVALTLARRPVLSILFGHQFLPATFLLVLLAWAIPMDFLTSYLSNAYIAWGMEKKILLCTAIAAGSNIVLNLIWIPRYAASAAAVNTLISYVILLASLALVGRAAKELNARAEPVPEMMA